MRESPSATVMRIVERDLRRARVQVRQLVEALIEAADHVGDYDADYAHALKTRAWAIALGIDRDGLREQLKS
jgi:hypothetical protein